MPRYRWNACYRHMEHAVWILACFLLLQSLLSAKHHQDNDDGRQYGAIQLIPMNSTKHLLYLNSIGKAKVKVNAPGFVAEDPAQEVFWKGAKIDIPGIITDARAKLNQCDIAFPSQTRKPDCSFKIFKQFFSTCGYFPDQGIWKNPDEQFPKSSFELKLCNLPSPTRIISDMPRTLMGQSIQHVVTVGSTHALKYQVAIRELLSAAGYECSRVKTHTRQFSRNDGRYHAKCQPNSTFTQAMENGNLEDNPVDKAPKKTAEDSIVHLHHYGVDSLGDRSLKCSNSTCSTQTEYIFKHKLRRAEVDILIIVPTFNLDKHTHFEIVYEQLKNTIAMVKKLRVEKVIWLTNPSEAPKKCPDYDVETFEFDFDGNGKINGLNHLLYQVLKPMLEDLEQDVFSLMDLFSISLSPLHLQETWNTNCVNYKKRWYLYIVSMIFGLL